MWMRKIIWWLILVYSYDKISAFNKILSQISPTPRIQMGQLFKLCYSERLNPIVITNSLIDVIDELRSNDKFPVMIIDRDFKAKDIQMFIPAYPLYIVLTDSIDQLQKLLNELNSTPMWNIVSIFFFIEIEENYCQNASQVLQLLWKLDLLSSFYFCIEPNNDMILYTYNPYISRAPDSWTEVDTDDKPDNWWTLYKQLYTPNDKKVCQSLNYDKTKALHVYEIKTIEDSRSWKNVIRNETYVSSFDYNLMNLEKIFMVNLFSALNVTLKINYDGPGFYRNKTAIGFLKSLTNATYNVSISLRIMEETAEVICIINLYNQNSFLILSQYRPFEIPIEEFANFYNINPAFILFIVVLAITFITIALNTDNYYAQFALNILQMILHTAILTPFQKLSMRFCFVVSFLMVFFMNPAIEGQIFSFMSTQNQHNIESLNNVYDCKCDFYYNPIFEPRIFYLNLWSTSSDRKFLHPIQFVYLGCSKYVLNNSSVACISYSEFQVWDALKYNLYVTKNLEIKNYMSFWVRKNWALKNRVDLIVLRMTEAGLLDYWDKHILHWPLSKIKAYKSIKIFTQYKQFSFENMLFAYIFFLLIIILALIVYGFEILLKKILF